ncbi:hypothetical protein [Oceanicoccus sagamiensis]|uniref:Glycosyltransferase RgtA/B/C/D-like domain-containing protein n=1 Tax=Oceanicoccus sagamiensis TaxID=716816 RepID=A0A1X9N865_9GAMM|nr:hypothetical protein [Oceanicoccus sagamiensis]ARN73876.1 hypothetical protein BST96_06965 [Oceanicoccus sagamiensis]
MDKYFSKFDIQIYCIVSIFGLISFALMHDVPRSGDEWSYVNAAKGVAEYLKSLIGLSDTAAVDIRTGLIGYGYFMPGLPILISPVYLFLGESAPLVFVRVYLLLINLSLLVLISKKIGRALSQKAALINLLICLSIPYYIAFLSAIWSELLGLHLAVLFLLHLDEKMQLGRTLSADIAAYWISLLCYIRAIYPSIIFVVLASWILAKLQHTSVKLSDCRDIVRRFLVMFLICAGLLSPWLISVSELYGPNFLVTSSGMSHFVHNADEQYVAEAKEAKSGYKGIWSSIHEYISYRAYDNHIPFADQLQLDKERYLVRQSLDERLKSISAYAKAYFALNSDSANKFLKRFEKLSCIGEDCEPNSLFGVAKAINSFSWPILFISGAVLFFLPMGVSQSGSYFMPFMWKGMLFILFLVPFLSTPHSRYYIQFVPLFGIGIGVLLSGGVRFYWKGDSFDISNVLVGLGQILAIAMVLITIGILVSF